MQAYKIEIIPEPEFGNEAIFKTLSPIFVQRDSVHLNPMEHAKIYTEAIRHNINVKHNLWHSVNVCFDLPELEILSKLKAKTIAFKEGTDKEIRNKGYLFNFRIAGDSRLIEMGYKTGFGQGNAMGFGCIESIDRKPTRTTGAQNRSNDTYIQSLLF